MINPIRSNRASNGVNDSLSRLGRAKKARPFFGEDVY